MLREASQPSPAPVSPAQPGQLRDRLPRPKIVFVATFYKGFYKGLGTQPFSRNLAFPAQVSQVAGLAGLGWLASRSILSQFLKYHCIF